jgi:hypothetical protein
MTTTALKPRVLLAVLMALVGAVSLWGGTSRAADTQGFQISPPVTLLSLDPGTSTKGKMKVTNLTRQQITLNITKQNFAAKGEEGEVQLVDNADPNYSLAPYFNLSQTTVDVPPVSSKEVDYTISVPVGAEPGGRYGSIVFTAATGTLAPGQSGAAVKQQLAGLIFLRINGNANEQIKIASFNSGNVDKAKKFTPASFFEYGPVSFQARFQNLGNVHEKPTGQIEIKNIFGIKVGTVKLDEQNVIPGAIRRTVSTWNRHLLLGYYTATLTAHNGTQQVLTAKTSFTVIPYKLLVVVLIIVLILFFVFWRGRKRLARAGRILSGRE